MAPVLQSKVVSALPTPLVADTVYYVRVAAGFDVYVTNHSGTVVAYPHNFAWAALTGKPTTLSGYGLTDAYTSAAVQSRGMNLVTNGTGLMGSNYNFSAFAFYPADTYVGGGSFMVSSRDAVLGNDELIPVLTQLFYTVKMALKSINAQTNNFAFVYVSQLDIDGNVVAPQYATWDTSTMTTLAAPLKPGDTTISLTNAAGWVQPKTNGGTQNLAEANSCIKIHNFKNSKGFYWPNQTYSRNVSGYAPYSYTTGVDIGANVITLRAPWTIANPDSALGWPIGTPIGVSFSGSTLLYPTNIVNTPISSTWTPATGIFGGGYQTDGQTSSSRFYYGVAYIKLGVLANRMLSTASTYPATSNTTLISGVYLSEINVQNLSGGSPGYSGSVVAGTKTLTIVNGIVTNVA